MGSVVSQAIVVACPTCGNIFYTTSYRISCGRGKFCSRYCCRHTVEAKLKMSKSNLGKKRTDAERKKMSVARTGENNGFYGHKHTVEAKIVIGMSSSKRRDSEETRRKKSVASRGENNPMFGKPSPMTGGHHTMETRKKQAFAHAGCKSYNWKGGITSANNTFRHSFEYRQWRTDVFTRDDYTCQGCGARSGNGKAVVLHADHIKPFYLYNGTNGYPDLRLDITNGRTLCIDCHKKTDTWKRPLKVTLSDSGFDTCQK